MLRCASFAMLGVCMCAAPYGSSSGRMSSIAIMSTFRLPTGAGTGTGRGSGGVGVALCLAPYVLFCVGWSFSFVGFAKRKQLPLAFQFQAPHFADAAHIAQQPPAASVLVEFVASRDAYALPVFHCPGSHSAAAARAGRARAISTRVAITYTGTLHR